MCIWVAAEHGASQLDFHLEEKPLMHLQLFPPCVFTKHNILFPPAEILTKEERIIYKQT